MTWNPTEASILGGTATISTFENGKVRQHLWLRVGSMTAVRVGAYLVIGFFFLITAWQFLPLLKKLPEILWIVGLFFMMAGIYIFLAVFFAAYAKLALRLEAIEMTDSYIRIQKFDSVLQAAWSEVREVRVSFTSWKSVYYLGGIPGEKTPVIYIRTDRWTHIIEWWRYPAEERKMAFQYIFRRVIPYNIPIVDDFGWVPAEYATYPHVIKGAKNEYEIMKKVGLYMMGIGALLCAILMGIGYATNYGNAFTASAFAFAVAFIGGFIWVGGAAGVDEEKKKAERAKLQ